MSRNVIGSYFTTGTKFLREHPQVWFTAFVGLIIVGAFIFTAYRFATITQETQEQYISDRVGWIYDALVLFVPDTFDRPDILRERLAKIREQNETINTITIYIPYNGNTWQKYVSDTGQGDRLYVDLNDPIYALAQLHTDKAYNKEEYRDGERHFTIARAITNPAWQVFALVVSEQSLS